MKIFADHFIGYTLSGAMEICVFISTRIHHHRSFYRELESAAAAAKDASRLLGKKKKEQLN
jgi:hypothetical protein